MFQVAPIAGETKVWQYITLMRRIYLIDCPGVVYPSAETDTEKVLKGVVRVELVSNPEDYIEEVLKRVKREYIRKTYCVENWSNTTEFLEAVAVKTGRLLKKGEPDISTVAKLVLNDWQRGKLPFYVPPTGFETPLTKQTLKNDEKVVGEEAKTLENTSKESEEARNSSKEKGEDGDKKIKPIQVDQDFTKIKVGLEYYEDTDKQLIEKNKVERLSGSGRKNSFKSDATTVYSDSDSEISYHSDMENGDEEGDEDFTSSEKSKKEICEIVQTSSGRFIVTDVDDYDTRKKEFMEREDDDDDKKPTKKLTAKQKRAIERSLKRKKTGSNFYEVKNVKSRKRNRKKPTLTD